MNDIRRLTVVATFLLVTLRLAIGWQLLYEGLWKIETLGTPKPWTSAGYLKNSQGPLRNMFRELAGDPDELGWIDVSRVSSQWDAWAKRFSDHYQLSENQQKRLSARLNGAEYYAAELEVFPDVIDLAALKLDSVVSYDPERKIIKIDGQKHMRPEEREKLIRAVPEDHPAAESFRIAVEKAYKRSKDGMSFKEQLAATVNGNPDLVSSDELQQVGKIDQYKSMLADYEGKLAAADQAFEWDHLNYTWGEIQTLKNELVGPVKALDYEFKEDARKMLSVEQLAKGPVPDPFTPLKISDTMTIAGLTGLGAMLLMGLFTRFAAFAAGIMVFMFYMAMPPWPNLPDPPGTEHSLVVNKNLIEVLALFAIAAMPTGRWFGVDGVIGWIFSKKQPAAETVSQKVPVTA